MNYVSQTVIQALKEFLGERLSQSEEVLAQHAKDVSHHLPRPPLAVAFPESSEEVSKIVQICAQANCPIIPTGRGPR